MPQYAVYAVDRSETTRRVTSWCHLSDHDTQEEAQAAAEKANRRSSWTVYEVARYMDGFGVRTPIFAGPA